MISVRKAVTELELNDVFNLRYLVFCEEKGRINVSGDYFKNMIIDQYDTYESSINIVAYSKGNPVGVARINIDSEAGLPPDSYFDLNSIRKENSVCDGLLGSVSMLAIAPAWRNRGTLVSLFVETCRELKKLGVGTIVGSISDDTYSIYRRMGFVRVGDPVWSRSVNDSVSLIKSAAEPVYGWVNRIDSSREANRILTQ